MRKTRPKSTQIPAAELAPIKEEELIDFIRKSMKTYGVEVNLERAVPDFRDGLKPVARRILWAMSQINVPKGVKAARLVGHTMGCFTGDTEVILASGKVKSLKQLTKEWAKNPEPFYVLSTDSKGRVVAAQAHTPRVTKNTKNLFEVTVEHKGSKHSYRCTEDHLFRVLTGEYVEAQNLEIGTRLLSLHVGDHKGYPYIMDGLKGSREWEFLHRRVARSLGKSIRGKHVHHIDEDTYNSDPSNLQVMTKSSHKEIHREDFSRKISLKARARFSIKTKEGRRNREIKSQITKESWVGAEDRREKARLIGKKFSKCLVDYTKTKKHRVDKSRLMKALGRDTEFQAKTRIGKVLKFAQTLLESGYTVRDLPYVWDENRPVPAYGCYKFKAAMSLLGVKGFSQLEAVLQSGELPSSNHRVVSVKRITLQSSVAVYDLSVEKYHNFIISSSGDALHGVVVHNCYHPHGDLSLYGATVTSVNSPVPPLEGKGNWGTLVDGPAAMRYPNVLLSTYGRSFFHKNFTPTMDMVPNFDRSYKEPLLLPALLPNLLFNGASGIGVGATTDIPAFTPKSVLRVMIRILKGEVLEVEDYAKGLEFYYQYGGKVLPTRQNKAAIRAFLASSKGSVTWSSPLEIDEVKKRIVISKFAPQISPIPLLEGVVGKDGKLKKKGIKHWDQVAQVYSDKGLSYVIQCRRDLNMNEFKAFADRVSKLTSSKVSYNINVTERLLAPDLGDDKYRVSFFNCSIPELIQKWLKWRCKLEATSLDWQIEKSKREIAFLSLLIYAADNLDVIFKALRTDNAAAYMVKHLELTLEQANQILDLQVRKLSKLDQTKLKSDLKAAKEYLASLKLKRKNPQGEVLAFFERVKDSFELYSEWAGTVQFGINRRVKETTS